MEVSIASASTQYSQNQIQEQASMKVASMAQDQAEQQAENISRLADSLVDVEASLDPNKGQAVDFRV